MLVRKGILPFLLLWLVSFYLPAQPSIGLSTNNISDSAICGDSVTIPLTIYNTGSTVLELWLSDGYVHQDSLYVSNINTDEIRKVHLDTFGFSSNIGSASDYGWSLKCTPDGSQLWSGDNWWDSVYVYNTANLSQIGAIRTGWGADGIAFTPDGSLAVVCNRWDDSISLVDVNTMTQINKIAYEYPMDAAITSDGEYAIVISADDNNGIIKVRLSDFTIVDQISTGSTGHAQIVLSPDDRYAFAGRGWDNEIVVVDLESFTEVTVFTGMSNPIGCDVTPDGKYVYFVDRLTSFLRRVNVETMTLTSILMPQVNNSRDLQIDQFGEFLYMSATNGYVYKVDLQSETVVDTLFDAGSFRGLEILRTRVSWASQDTGFLSIPAGDSAVVMVTFDGTQLQGGSYSGYLFTRSNDPSSQYDTVSLNFNVIGQPQFIVDQSCVDFDTVFQYATTTLPVIISNPGCDTLDLTNVTTTLGAYSVSPTTGQVYPGDSLQLDVTFTTTGVGSFPASMTIQTNEGDSTLCLSALSIPGPELIFTPSVINATSSDCDDTLTYVVDIENAGVQPLTGSVIYSAVNEPSLQDALDSLNSSYTSVTANIPSIYNFSDGLFGNSISDGGGDMYDGGNYLNTNLGCCIPYTNNALGSVSQLGVGSEYFTFKGNGLFVFAADMYGVTSFDISGNLGADGSGSVDTSRIQFSVGSYNFTGFIKRVYNAFDPSVNHLIIIPTTPGVGHSYSTDTDDDDHAITGIGSITRMYHILYAGSGGSYIDDAAALQIMASFIDLLYAGSDFLSVDTTGIGVAAGDTSQLTVTLRTKKLIQGNYTEYLILNTNDPLHPVDSIVVNLNFNGEAELLAQDSCLTLDTVFQFGSVNDSLWITNAGCDTLTIDSHSVSNGQFTVSYDTNVLFPGDTVQVHVSFSPTSFGSYSEQFTLFTDLVDSSFCLIGEALQPPSMTVSPLSIDTFVTGCDDSIYVPIQIQNSGASSLIYSSQESSFNSNMSLDSVLARLVSGSGDISNVIPNRFDFTDGVSGTRIIDGGSDMYDFGNYLRTNYGGYLFYSNNTVASSPYFGTTGEYFTHKGTGLFVMAADMDNVSYFRVSGGTGHDGGGNVDTLDMIVTREGVDYLVLVKRVYGETEPSVNHIFLLQYDASVYDTYNTYTYNDLHYAWNLNSVERFYYLAFGAQNGGLITASQIRNIAEEFLDVIHGGEPWMELQDPADTVLSSTTLNTSLLLTSTGLVQGVYTGFVAINGNDPLNPTDTISVTFEVIGEAIPVYDSACISFDTTLQYGTYIDTFVILNTGCDTLSISAALSDTNNYAIDTNLLSILPGDTDTIVVTFTPQLTGAYGDSLLLTTNAGDTSICLTSFALPPPTVNIDPSTIDTVVVGCDDSLLVPVKIYNTGGSDLTFSISGSSGDGLQEILDRLNAGHTNITSEIPSPYSFIDGVTGNSISDGGGDMYDGGNSLYTNLGGALNYSDNTVISSTVFGSSGQYFTRKVNQLFVLAADIENITSFYINGNLGADGSGNYDFTTISYNLYGTTYTGFIRRVYNAGDPSINQIIIVPNASGVTQTGSPNTNFGFHQVTGLNSVTRIYYLLFARTSGGYVPNGDMQDVMEAFLNEVVGPPSLVSIPVGDTVAPGDTSTVQMIISSAGLNSGSYNFTAYVNSNDPLTSTDSIQISYDVIGDPIIALSDSCITTDTIFQYGTWTDSFTIFNTGCDTLIIDSIYANNGFYTFSASNDSIEPGDSMNVQVIFAPTVADTTIDSIYIANNATDTFICVTAVSIPPPAISFTPTSIDTSIIGCDDTLDVPITITNTGQANLFFNSYVTETQLPDLSDVLAELLANSNSISNVIPNRYDFTEGVTGNRIIDGGNDMYNFGNYLYSPTYGYLPYSNNTINAGNFLGTDTRYFTHKGQGLFVMAGDLNSLNYFYTTGSTGTGGAGNTDTANFHITFNGQDYIVFVRRVWGSTDPSVNHLWIMQDDPSVTQNLNTNSASDYDYIYNLNSVDRLYYVLFSGESGAYMSDDVMHDVAEAFLAAINVGDPWISMGMQADTLAPTEDTTTFVRFISTGIEAGTYQGYVYLTSNDPLLPLDSIAVTLDIIGEAVIDLSDSCITSDTTIELATSAAQLSIYNTGCDTLVIDSAVSSSGVWTIDPSDTVVYLGDTAIVNVQFAPLDTGFISDSLWIYSNSFDTAICVSGYATPRPIIGLDTDTLYFDLSACCDTTDVTFNIYNSGLGELDWNAAIETGVEDNFDGGINTAIWSSITGVSAITCGSQSGDALYFSDNVSRVAETVDLDASAGGTVTFYLKIAYSSGGACETADGGENVVLEYSTNGGSSWNNVTTYFTGATYQNFTYIEEPIPLAAQTSNTRFRWRQVSFSGSCCDHWSIDEMSITSLANASIDPDTATTLPNDSTEVTVSFDACGLPLGTYNQTLSIYSNDPLTPYLTLELQYVKPDTPSAPLINDLSICEGDSTLPFVAIGENITWYSDSLLSTIVGTGDTFDSGIDSVGVYTFYLTQTIDDCEGDVDTFVFTINQAPTQPFALDTFGCEGSTIPDLFAAGSTIRWYSDTALTVLEHSGQTFSTGLTAFGLYEFYVTDSLPGCPATVPDTATLFIDSIPGTPNVGDTTICFGEPVPTLFAPGDSIRWYSDPGLSTLLATGNLFNPTITVAGTYNYYVVEVDSITGCQSLYDEATIDAQAAPGLPTVANDTGCFGGTIPPLVAGGVNLVWYSDTGLTSLAGTGDTLNTGQTAVGAYTYYVNQTIGTCTGPADSATLIISAPPITPSALDTAICEGEATPDLTATGTGLRWYSDTGLTTLIYAGDTLSPGVTAAGTYEYYVVQNAGGCEGDADTSSLIIHSNPSIPIGSDTFTCFGQPVPDLTASGSWNQWYSDSSLTTLEDTGSSFATGETTVGSYTYYVTDLDSITGCESGADDVTLVINNAPTQPNGTDTSLCFLQTVPDLIATGSFIQWYSDPTLDTLVNSGDTFSTGLTAPGTYTFYLTDSLPGCPEGPVDTAVLDILPLADAAQITDTSICFGDSVPALINTTVGSATCYWFADASLTTLIDSGDTFFTGQTSAGSYTYYAVRDSIGCFSAVDSATLTIIGIPSTPVTQDTNFCEGGTEAPLVAIGTSINWYADTGLTTFVGSGDSLFAGQTAVGSYTYYATQGLNGCSGPSDSATLTIKPVPGAVSVSDTSICDGETIPAFTASGTNVRWYADTGLTTLLDTGASFTPSPAGTGTFIYYATQTVDGCESTPDTALLTIHTIPAAPSANDTSICELDSVPSLTALGTALLWYSDTALTTLVGSGVSYATGASSVGTYEAYVTQTVNGCESAADTATLVVNAAPGTPTASADTAICEGETVPTFSATGTNLTWIDSAGTTLGTGTSFTPSDSVSGAYLYLVVDSLPGCPTSDPDSVELVIHAIPLPPSTDDTVICFGQTVPDLEAIGTAIEWYSDSALTTLVDTGNTLATGQTAVGSYTYYVRQTVNGCTSPAQAVTLAIAPVPSVPVASDTTICFGEVAVFTSSGSNLQWYSDSLLNNLAGTGDSLSISGLSVGDTSFYVTDSLSGCPASGADTADVTVLPIPSAPATSDTAVCFGESIPGLIASGSDVQWFSDSTLTTLVDTGNVFNSGDTAVGSYTYYATQTVDGCEGAFSSVTLTINGIPTTPTAEDTAVCINEVIPDLTALGSLIRWYQDTGLTTQLDTGNTFATGQTASGTYTYYITQSILGCESPSDSASLTIYDLPSAPVVEDSTICFGEPVPSFEATGGVITWYSDTSASPLHTGDTFLPVISIADTFTFLVTSTVNGCEGPADTFNLVVHPLPGAPGLSDTTVCETEAIPTLNASGSGLTWYSDNGLTTVVATGPSYNPGSLSVGSYTYYATQNVLGCEGPADSVTLTVSAQPSSPGVSDTTVCEADPIPALYASGSSIRWYSDTALTSLEGTGDSLVTGQTSPGAYTYYATQSVGVCESQADSATLVILATPASPFVSDTSVCEGEAVPPLIASGISINWYVDSSTATVLFSGDTLNTGQTLPDTHSYYASQTIGGCESPRTISSLIIRPLPSTPVLSGDSACFGESNPALYAIGNGVQWYDDAALTSLIDTGDSTVPTPSAVGSYTYYATQIVDGCEGPADSVEFTIAPIPSAPVVEDTTFCIGTAVPALTSTGTNVQWYDDPGLDTLVNSGSSFTPSISSAGNYDYFVTQLISGCESSPDTSTVIALAEPAVPSIGDSAVCFGTSNPTFNSGSASTYWYDNATLSSAVDSGSNFTPTVSAVGSYTYYARNIENGCEGDTTSFTLLINSLPVSPILSDTQVCEGDTGILIGEGSLLEWYADSSLTSSLATGDTFNTGQTSVGTYTYYATQTVNGCTSDWDSVQLTVLAPPQAPLASDTALCEGLSVPPLTATGTNLAWYADATLDSLVGSGSTFASGQSSEGVYTYYVTQTVNGCEGAPDTATLTITGAPLAPIAEDLIVCEGEVVPSIIAQGSAIQWYSDTGLTNLIATGNTFDTNLVVAGVYNFYATQTENGCPGPADTATVAIIAIPQAPTVADTSVCFGSENPPFILGNNGGRWYDNESMLIPVWEGDSFTSEAYNVGIYTYYVTQQDSGCESAADTIHLAVLPRPLVTLNTYGESIISGDSVYLEAFNAVDYTWTPSEGLSAITGASVMAGPQVTTTYTVTGSNEEGCSNDTNVTITVFPLGVASQLSDQLDLKVFPNPNRGQFTLAFEVPVRDDYNLTIVNKLGEVVQTDHIHASDFVRNRWVKDYDLYDLSAGIYLIHVRSEHAVSVLRVIIQ